ncbi:MAG: TatD family hydrolase [Chloroflexi bacterium]|nr:TatD family hydrolase [Chloroflexota bacterium]
MHLIDTHAHLEEVADLDGALARAKQAGVVAVIAVGSDLASNQRILEIADRYRGFVYPALGLHPGNLGDIAHQEATFRLIETNLDRLVGVGEIGLDYHYRDARKSEEVRETQKRAYSRALALARDSGKPALIHSRGSWQDCVDLAQELKVEKAIFHWYSGPVDVLQQALSAGYFVSATPATEYSEGHRRALLHVGIERLMLETDSPVAYKGVPAEPAHVLKTLSAVSALKGAAADVIAQATTNNARKVFGM